MRRSRQFPEVNAGSMADIAFLLLIFFLVTAVIPKDQGINRKLPPPCPPNEICSESIKKERNIFRISINNKNEIMVEDNIIHLEDLKDLTKTFLDNNGDGSCYYCQGSQSADSSDNPSQAVISLQNDQLTSYARFIQVQDELTKAYFELRETYSLNILKKAVVDLNIDELKQVKDAYPFILSEAVLK